MNTFEGRLCYLFLSRFLMLLSYYENYFLFLHIFHCDYTNILRIHEFCRYLGLSEQVEQPSSFSSSSSVGLVMLLLRLYVVVVVIVIVMMRQHIRLSVVLLCNSQPASQPTLFISG